MKILKVLFVGVLILIFTAGLAYAGSKGKEKGAENGKAKGQAENAKNENKNGQTRGQSVTAPGQLKATLVSSDRRKNVIEKGKNQAALKTSRPVKENRGRGVEHRRIKGDNNSANGLFKALGKSRWFYNPHDDRGQGNMGKPNMRDPYGHDKDSGREGSERGRAIHGSSLSELLTQGELLSIDFTMPDYYLQRLQALLDEAIENEIAARINLFTFLINHWIANPTPYNWMYPQTDETISYTLTLPDEFDGETLLVTTTLTSIYDFFDVLGGAVGAGVSYAAGDVIMEETQEVVLGENDTYSYSYDPPVTLAGWGQLDADLTVTVTEPESGASYTMNYDKYLILYRCPYGKVTDTKTGQTIVGAKVTVHFEDGSIVALDKASNPTASNPQITDATGRYGFKLQINRKYYLTATRSGYKDYKSEVFTEKWHILREDIVLAPIEKHQVALNVE